MLFVSKYPKLSMLAVAFAAAYVVFSFSFVKDLFSNHELSYVGAFIAGIMYSFGFTAPFATGVFLHLKPQNIVFASLLGGIGAMLYDLAFFSFARFSFMGEFEKLRGELLVRKSYNIFVKIFGYRIQEFWFFILAMFFFASPFPDEAGILLFAGFTKIKPLHLALLGFFLNFIGIYVLMLL